MLDGELVDLAEGLVAVRRRGAAPAGRTAADLLVATYMLDGLEGVTRLEGCYFFVLWDGRSQVAYLGGDRHASRPHFYAMQEDRLVVAPDVRGVLAALDGRPPVCWQGVAEFLALEHPLADRTFFQGLRAFPGGTYLAATPRGTRWHVYWTPRYSGGAEPGARVQDFLAPAVERYRAAVARRLEGRCVLSLSGGTDSRLLLALLGDTRLPTFTFGEDGTADMRYAAQAAAAAGFEHERVPLRPDFLAHHAPLVIARGEGMSSLFHAHNLDGLSEVRALAPVVLCGAAAEFARLDYAENVLAATGPTWQLLARRALEGRRPLAPVADDEELVRRLLGYAWNVVTPAMADELLAPELARAMVQTLKRGLASQLAHIQGATPEDRLMTFNLINRQRRFSQWGLTLSATELTYRKPLEDYALVDFLLRVPAATRRELPAAVVAQVAPALARVPITGTGAPLDASFPERVAAYMRKQARQRLAPGRKQSFGDPQENLRGASRAYFEQVLLDPGTLGNGIFNGPGVERLWRAHQAGHVDAAAPLCALATVELWRRAYLAPQPRPEATATKSPPADA
jgi:hypothetical protein